MRKRKKCPVCRCTPVQGITHINVRLLLQLLNREVHPIKCAWNNRRKAQKAQILGDLCVNSNHPELAIKIWAFVENLLIIQDYRWFKSHWAYNPEWMNLSSLMAEPEALELGRRIDQLYLKMKHPEYVGYEDYAKNHFYWTKYYSKPDYYDWLKETKCYMEEIRKQKAAENMFNDGNTDYNPAYSVFKNTQ